MSWRWSWTPTAGGQPDARFARQIRLSPSPLRGGRRRRVLRRRRRGSAAAWRHTSIHTGPTTPPPTASRPTTSSRTTATAPTDVIVLFQHAPVASAQTKSRVEAVEHQLRARGDVARVTGYYDTRSTRLRLARPRRDLPRRGAAADRRQGAPGRGVQHRGPAQRQARRHGRRRRAGPGAGQQADRVRPAPRRAARVPAPLPALAAVLPQPGRLAPAAARRRPGDRRHLPDPAESRARSARSRSSPST